MLREGRLKSGILTKALVLIPHYDHPAAIVRIAQTMHDFDLDILIVDDDSYEECRPVLQVLISDDIRVLYRPVNGGKDAAVETGLKYTEEHGYSHVLQVDVDSQHHLDDTPKPLAAAEQNLEAVVCGWPQCGDDVPRARLYGHKITDFWNMLHVQSCDIKDGMCGFHLYPLTPALSVVREEIVDDRMDFDMKILVRLYWHDIKSVQTKTPVQYAADDVSHFNAFTDNVCIDKMHTRLSLRMLRRRLSALLGKGHLRQ